MAIRLFREKFDPSVKDLDYQADFAKHAATYAFILSLAGVVTTAAGIEALTQADIVPGSLATIVGGLWTLAFVSTGFSERSNYKYYLGELAIEIEKQDQSPQTNQN